LQEDCFYEVVIFSHTLEMQDIESLGQIIQKRKASTKVLLVLGPDSESMPLDYSYFDATIAGLDGPAAFIQAVRRLASTVS